MPSSPLVSEFTFDDENEEEMTAHGISPQRAIEVLDEVFQIKRNRAGRRAPYLLVGRDRQGQCIAIPIEPTPLRGVWRPVTAWHCKHHEWGWLPRKR